MSLSLGAADAIESRVASLLASVKELRTRALDLATRNELLLKENADLYDRLYKAEETIKELRAHTPVECK